MTEHHWFIDDKAADAAVQVVMNIAATYPDVGNLDANIVGAQMLGNRIVAQGQGFFLVEVQGFHCSNPKRGKRVGGGRSNKAG